MLTQHMGADDANMLKKLFDERDFSKTGKLDAAGVKLLLEDIARLDTRVHMQRMNRHLQLATDEAGMVSSQAVLEAHARAAFDHANQENVAHLYEHLEFDDGIPRDQLRDMCNITEDELAEMMQEMNVGSDSRVEFSGFLKLMQHEAFSEESRNTSRRDNSQLNPHSRLLLSRQHSRNAPPHLAHRPSISEMIPLSCTPQMHARPRLSISEMPSSTPRP